MTRQEVLIAFLFMVDCIKRDRVKFWGTAEMNENDPALLRSLMPSEQSAIRVTNSNNEYAVKLGIFSARLLKIAIDTGNLSSVIDAAINEQDPLVAPLTKNVSKQKNVTPPLSKETIPKAWLSQLHDRELVTTNSTFLAS